MHQIFKFNIKHILHQRQITAFDIAIFLRQLATLISAGISIIKSCDILEKSQHKIALNRLIHDIKLEIASGKSLYPCFKRHPQYFDDITCQMIHVGEQTGKLDSILLSIAAHHEKHLLFKRKIKQALFYPTMIMITAIMVCFCMIIFIIPKFAELFQDFQNKLPLFTRCVFAISLTIKNNLLLIVTMLIISCLSIYCLRDKSRSLIQTIFKRTPYIKSIFSKIILVRFCRNLAISLSAGVPISDALQLSTINDREFSIVIAKLRSRIHAGIQLNRAMEDMIFFPMLMVQMVKIGEESGLLEHMLDKLAQFFENDIDQFTSTLSQTLEPLIIIILGVLIGGLVIAMYLPIFKLGNIM